MKKLLPLLLIMFLSCINSYAQQKFIKVTTATGFGSTLRILPTADNGWVVFSMDSLKLSKFNSCGKSEWSKKYNIPNSSIGLSDFIQTQNNDFVLLTRFPNGNIYSALITRLNASGNILWSKSYEDQVYTQFPYTISEDNQGNIFLFCNVENTNDNSVFNQISKINANGNLLWTRYYDHGWVWGGAIVTSDNGLLIRTGTNFIKTDNAGNVQWHSQFLSVGYYYLAPVEVSDGYIFTGYTSPGQQIVFGKMDKTGNPLWGGRKTSDFNGNPPQLRRLKNGNFTGVFSKNFSSQIYTTIIEFDKDLNIISQNSIDNAGAILFARDICFTTDNTPVITGATGNAMFIAKLDVAYKSSCDIAIPAMTFTNDPVTQTFVNTNVYNFSFNELTRNYTVDTFSIDMTPLCMITKYLELGNDTNICGQASLTLKNRNSDVFDSYLWSTGDTTPSISISQAGTYWMQATYNCGEIIVSDTILITVTPVTSANLGDDLLICKDSSEILTAPLCSSCSYSWNNGSTLSIIEIKDAGTYWLVIDNNNGCITSDTIEASIVKCDCSFYVPNAFTPNDDGSNDNFFPVFDCDLTNYDLKIFNRWGQLIFTTKNIKTGWNGKFQNVEVPQEIYMYMVSYQPIIKGAVKNNVLKSGTITVIY